MAPALGPAQGAPWLHHNPAYAAEAEGVRGFLGQSWVHQVSVTFHTTGALLIAGALLAVLLMTHRMRSVTDAGEAFMIRSRGLPWARALVVAGWALNLVGGSMRLFEPDHPSIAEAGTVSWVQVLLVKHLFILVALVASMVAVEWAPKVWRRLSPHAAGLGITMVFLSAILGGVSTGLTIPAQEAMMAQDPVGLPSAPPGEHVVDYKNTSFQVSGNPLQPWRQEFPFDVDHWAFNMSARIEWTMEQSEITGYLVDPNGNTVKNLDPGPTWAQDHVDVNLYPGGWALVIRSEQALVSQDGLRETVNVIVKIDRGTSGTRVLEDTVTVGRDGFFELNFWMDAGDEFHHDWSVPGAHGPVYWDIHTHPSPTVVRYLAQGEEFSADGHFEAGNERIYSILWAPADDKAFTLSYRVEGDFRVHSVYR